MLGVHADMEMTREESQHLDFDNFRHPEMRWNKDGALIREDHMPQQSQQRSFSRAMWPRHGHQLALLRLNSDLTRAHFLQISKEFNKETSKLLDGQADSLTIID